MLTESLNLSIDADPQQQEAAPPLMLVVRSFLRCAGQPPLVSLQALAWVPVARPHRALRQEAGGFCSTIAANRSRFKRRGLSSIPFVSLLVVTHRRIAAGIVGFVSAPVAAAATRALQGAQNHTKRVPLFPFRQNAGILPSSLPGRPCTTSQSTRTHNCRRRLRRKCWWSGHFYVIRRSDMQREHVPPDLTAAAFEFFFSFTRFEFALKENSYLETHKPGSKADPGWREFVEKYEVSYVLSEKAKELVALSPKEQLVGPGDSLMWEPIVFSTNVSPLKEVVYLLKTVRNNLFHGGKHGEVAWDDSDRMRKLLSVALAVLDELAVLGSLVADYRRSY